MAKAPPVSVRIPDDVQQHLDAEVSEKLTRNAIIIDALRKRYGLGAKERRAPKAGQPEVRRPKPGALLEKKGRDKWRL